MTLKTGVEGEWGIVLDKMRCRLCNILTSLGRVLVPYFDSDETISQVALHVGMMLICRPVRGRYLTGVVVRQLWRVFPTQNYMAMQGTLSHLSKRVCLAFRSVSLPNDDHILLVCMCLDTYQLGLWWQASIQQILPMPTGPLATDEGNLPASPGAWLRLSASMKLGLFRF